MNQVQFLTDSMAGLFAAACAAAGLELPVYGQVTDPTAEHDCMEVRCEGVDELIPGNYTMRVDCSVVLRLGAATREAEEIEALAGVIGEAVRGVLLRDWKYKPLPWPETLEDEAERQEYEEMPYVVLDMLAEPASVEVAAQYEWAVRFRVYIQF